MRLGSHVQECKLRVVQSLTEPCGACMQMRPACSGAAARASRARRRRARCCGRAGNALARTATGRAARRASRVPCSAPSTARCATRRAPVVPHTYLHRPFLPLAPALRAEQESGKFCRGALHSAVQGRHLGRPKPCLCSPQEYIHAGQEPAAVADAARDAPYGAERPHSQAQPSGTQAAAHGRRRRRRHVCSPAPCKPADGLL